MSLVSSSLHANETVIFVRCSEKVGGVCVQKTNRCVQESNLNFRMSSEAHTKKIKRVKNIHAPSWGMHGVIYKKKKKNVSIKSS